MSPLLHLNLSGPCVSLIFKMSLGKNLSYILIGLWFESNSHCTSFLHPITSYTGRIYRNSFVLISSHFRKWFLFFYPNQEIYYSDRQASGKKERLDFEIAETASLGDNLNSSFVSNTNGSVPFSDVTLMCKGKSFPCHKFMLAARSVLHSLNFLTNLSSNHTKTVWLFQLKNYFLTLANFTG